MSFLESELSRVAQKVNLSTRNSSHVFIFHKVTETEIMGFTNFACLTIKSFADCQTVFTMEGSEGPRTPLPPFPPLEKPVDI